MRKLLFPDLKGSPQKLIGDEVAEKPEKCRAGLKEERVISATPPVSPMDFYTLVLYSAAAVAIAVPVACYFFYLYTRCCPGREPPVAVKPAPPGPGKLIRRRIMCTSQDEAEQKSRRYSGGRDPWLDPPHLTGKNPLPQYHYHLANRAKCMVRGRLVSYEFLFPGIPTIEDQQMLEQRAERRKALQQMAIRTGPLLVAPHLTTDSALFQNDSDYELIDEEDDDDSMDDIQYLDL